ncbi:Sporulation protein YjcZ [Paenibacillus lactis]|uniref:Uncharacterized protein n=3 Tax=Paenibacillus lactis TaxID=228574 RepID=G4HDW7_9BACL|nr:hypothetical protein PaelaDRAFT_2178 [Paenibacillus lactis 154]MBP1895090.1 hypothetical protein [Paenibacillus lactis]HAF99784.1 sporulation protein YjcZ [Paenibacillus lactis]
MGEYGVGSYGRQAEFGEFLLIIILFILLVILLNYFLI